jgi:hypothetical protein
VTRIPVASPSFHTPLWQSLSKDTAFVLLVSSLFLHFLARHSQLKKLAHSAAAGEMDIFGYEHFHHSVAST